LIMTTVLLDKIAVRSQVDSVDVFARPFFVHDSLALLGLPASDANSVRGSRPCPADYGPRPDRL
jgi:hypothetical protein